MSGAVISAAAYTQFMIEQARQKEQAARDQAAAQAKAAADAKAAAQAKAAADAKAAALQKVTEDFATYKNRKEAIQKQLKTLPTYSKQIGSHRALVNFLPPGTPPKYTIQKYVDVPDYETGLTAEGKIKQKELTTELELLNSKAEQEAADYPEFNQMLYKYNNPPVTTQDVYDVGKANWGSSITEMIYRHNMVFPSNDALKFQSLKNYVKEHPEVSKQELMNIAKGIQGYSSPRNAAGYNAQTKSVTIGAGSGGSVVVSKSASEEKTAAQKAAAGAGYTADAKVTPLVSQYFKQVDGGIMSTNLVATPSVDIAAQIRASQAQQSERPTILSNQPDSKYANPSFISRESQKKIDAMRKSEPTTVTEIQRPTILSNQPDSKYANPSFISLDAQKKIDAMRKPTVSEMPKTEQRYDLVVNGQTIPNLTQGQVDEYEKAFGLIQRVEKYQARQKNLDAVNSLKSTLASYKTEGVSEIAIKSNGIVNTVPLEFAYKKILEAPQGSTYSPVKPSNIPEGFTVAGPLSEPTFIQVPRQQIGPKQEPGFFEGLTAPIYNIGATIAQTEIAIIKEIQKPGSGFEFRGPGLPENGVERNPLNLPYPKTEQNINPFGNDVTPYQTKPTAFGSLISGQVPPLNEYMAGTAVTDIALAVLPGTKIPRPKPKSTIGTPPEGFKTNLFRNNGLEDSPVITSGTAPPEYAAIKNMFNKIPEPAVAIHTSFAKVPKIPNTESLEASQRISELEKIRLTKTTTPVQADPFYNPSQNVPITRANKPGTYRVQSDQLTGPTVNPIRDIFNSAPEPLVKDTGVVYGKVPKIPNTESLEASQRISELEKIRLTKTTTPVQADPFYNPSQNVPITRANKPGTYRVQSDQLTGPTVNPIRDIFNSAPEPLVSDVTTKGPTAASIAQKQIFKQQNPLLFTKKPEGTSPPSGGGGGGGGWKSTNVNLGKGIGISVKRDGTGGVFSSSRPSSPPPPQPPTNDKIINTKGGSLIVKTKQEPKASATYVKLGEGQATIVKTIQKPKIVIIKKPVIATIQNSTQQVKQKQNQPQLIKQAQKSKQIRIVKQAQPQIFKQSEKQKQPQVTKLAQPFKQSQKQAQPQIFKQLEKPKQVTKQTTKQQFRYSFSPIQKQKTETEQVPKKIIIKEEKPPKPEKLFMMMPRNYPKNSRSKHGSKADFLGNTHLASITGFRSKNDITYGRKKTQKLADKDIAKTTRQKKFRL